MSELLLTDSIRTIEHDAIAALGDGVLMARAAAAVADAVAGLARRAPRATPILALVGPGNNGGDALLAAMNLAARGFPVVPLALSSQPPAATDALAVRQRWQAAGGNLHPIEALAGWLAQAPIVIDGLFGIGLARPLEGEAAQAVARLRPHAARVVAIDVPSGLDADRGTVVGGRQGCALRAALTVTMLADKPGLHTAAGPDHAGAVLVADLGLRATRPRAGPAAPADGRLIDAAHVAARTAPRARDSHKGSFGGVLIAGGTSGTTGAALLAARGAQAIGAGKVWIASPDERVFDPGQPQLMTRDFDAPYDGVDAICIGCGLGQAEPARQAFLRALRAALPMAIDADALNLAATDPALARRLAAGDAPVVLTPHPLEAARLLGLDTATVQSDRITHALALARRFRATVILKGAGSVVASADGRWDIVGSGGPALATAGTGDVLAGMVAGLLAQGHAAHDAAGLGAWLHGAAGDAWQRAHPAAIGLSAALLPHFVPDALDALPAR